MSRRRAFIYGIFFVSTLTSVARSAPFPKAEPKNLLAAIRQNRTTQADFHEQRVIRLMKNPVVSSGTLWFHLPNKFRCEVEGNSPSITVSDGRELWIYYPNFKSAERYPLGKGPPLGCNGHDDEFRTQPRKYRNHSNWSSVLLSLAQAPRTVCVMTC